MRRKEKKRPELEEFDDDLSDSDVNLGPDPDDPDYRAVRLTIFGGHCAWRDPKKKLKADPYLRVTYQGSTKETTELANTTHPKWNETMEFPIYNINALGQLSIDMWDANGKPTEKGQIFMGNVQISIAELQDVNVDFAEPRSYKLGPRNKPHKTDNVRGDVMLKIGMVIPRKTPDFTPEKGKAQTTEQVIREAEYIVDDSLASVQRSLRMAENTRMIGAETLDKLNAQGEQIVRIQEHLDNIDESQSEADRHLRAISSIGGAFGNNFRRRPPRRDGVKKGDKLAAKKKREREKKQKGEADSDDDDLANDLDDDGLVSRESRTDRHLRHKEATASAKNGRITDMYQADYSMLSDSAQAKIKETDRGIDRIGHIIDDLKVIALEMGDEIDTHNARLEVMEDSVARANSRMRNHNTKIGRKVK
eukprot:TRINITY_DN16212_c0_g1_i1.p1 TRINITY_DN16212_c0_g1~~TRINITY_DN16212_c0_g1_i1.p1  ORF type:complete len:420 (+),score=102.64 TRINITY_DN16212_c0_g1_i1:21-1280(+)